MHILMLADRMDIGGAETHIFSLCHALRERGHAVTLLSAGGCYARLLEEDGVHTVLWPADKRHPIAVLRCMLRLRRLLRQHSIDIMHAHTRFTATLASRMFGKRCPTVSTAHLPFSCTHKERLLMHWGVHTLAVSADIRAHMLHTYGLPEEQVSLTVNGIDTDRFHVLPREGDAIVHTSRFDPDRSACALLLCALAPRLLAEHPDRRIHLIGDGAWAERVRSAADEANRALGFEGVRVFPKTTDLPSVLRAGCIFVGVSRAALEAMSMGLPVILAGNEGYGGILDEEHFSHATRTNFCAREDTPTTLELLYRDIKALLLDTAHRQALRAFGAQAVRHSYSAAIMASDALTVYCRVLRPKSAFLIGYYGYGNLGDETTLSLIKSALMKRNIYNIHVFSKETSEDGSHVKRTRIFKIQQLIRTSDLILFGGGNLLQNETSRRSLLLYGWLLRYAHAHGKRVIMISTGIGRVTGGHARSMLSRLLSYSAGIFLRTAADTREAIVLLQARKAAPHIGKSHDICFSLREQVVSCSRHRILFILRTVQDREALFSLQVAVERLRRHGHSIAFLVMHSAQDHTLSYSLAKLFSAPILSADSFMSFVEYTMDAQLIISDRLHGAILSLLCHIPCYLSSRSVKNRRLIEDVVCAAHTSALPSPLLGYEDFSALNRRLFYKGKRRAARCLGVRQAVAKRRVSAFMHTVSFAHPWRKKQVGGAQASDFGRILRSLRAGASWESFAFYEDM